MNKELLFELSNAYGIASNEQQIRDILYRELKEYCDEILFDKLGSIIFHKKSNNPNALKIMFMAHMDEVGFMVRYISELGLIYLQPIGGVLDKSKEMQMVAITTKDGTVIKGLLNVTKDDAGKVKEMYVDISEDSYQGVIDTGIDVGDMVCFTSQAMDMQDDVYAGKAMDDRTGCYVLIEALKQIKNTSNDLYFVATSSEEVGLRGAKLSSHMIQPDVVFAIDVANTSEHNHSLSNKRRLGKGIMIEHYDKTMIPNPKLLQFVKTLATTLSIPYQSDMFGGGGTDCGSAHLEHDGALAIVLGIPLRYCHSTYSFVHKKELEDMVHMVCGLCHALTKEKYDEFIDFVGGK